MNWKVTLGFCLVLAPVAYGAIRQKEMKSAPAEETYKNPMEDPELMQKMMMYATPGEAHAELAKGVGTWKVAGKMFMGPGSEAMPMNATAESKTILGGRFLMEEFKSDFMGMPFEGVLILGYNNLDQEYVSVWMDTWSTGFSFAQGPELASGEVEMKGKMRDALTPEGRPYRHVSSHTGENAFTVSMYDTLPDGTEWKVMELNYTR